MSDMHLNFDFGSGDLLLSADPNLVKRVIKCLYLQCLFKPLNYPSEYDIQVEVNLMSVCKNPNLEKEKWESEMFLQEVTASPD